MTERTDREQRPIHAGIAVGYLAIFAGGIIAAITAPLGLEKGSWLAAYLILVAGLAQLLLSHQCQILHVRLPAARASWIQLSFFVAGNVAVIIGSLLSQPIVVNLGGIGLIGALGIAIRNAAAAPQVWRKWALQLFYAAVVISVPIGLVLAHMRA